MMQKVLTVMALIAVIVVIVLLIAMGVEILMLDKNPVVISLLAAGIAVCMLVILVYAIWQAMGSK